MPDDKIYTEPSDVTVKDEAIALNGPDGVDVKLTPEAAEETTDRLLNAVVTVRGKHLLSKLSRRPK